MSYCALIGMSHKLLPTLYRQLRLEYELVDVCPCRYPQGQSRTATCETEQKIAMKENS